MSNNRIVVPTKFVMPPKSILSYEDGIELIKEHFRIENDNNRIIFDGEEVYINEVIVDPIREIGTDTIYTVHLILERKSKTIVRYTALESIIGHADRKLKDSFKVYIKEERG